MNEGYGRRLRLDLSTGEITKSKIGEDITRDFIGGKGFTAKSTSR
jgi:aldehyde:ferredoxin oxidoreductase